MKKICYRPITICDLKNDIFENVPILSLFPWNVLTATTVEDKLCDVERLFICEPIHAYTFLPSED